jgi:hypothetical protein
MFTSGLYNCLYGCFYVCTVFTNGLYKRTWIGGDPFRNWPCHGFQEAPQAKEASRVAQALLTTRTRQRQPPTPFRIRIGYELGRKAAIDEIKAWAGNVTGSQHDAYARTGRPW